MRGVKTVEKLMSNFFETSDIAFWEKSFYLLSLTILLQILATALSFHLFHMNLALFFMFTTSVASVVFMAVVCKLFTPKEYKYYDGTALEQKY